MKKQKKLKSQQLVEFLLVAPFMIIILGILTEYAYALNINMVLNNGLKTVTSAVYSKTEPNIDKAALIYSVKSELINYLKSNNIGVSTENNLKVDYVVLGTNAVFLANFKYITAFTLPNVYFHFLPESFNFSATAAVPASFLYSNGYDNTLSSEKLDQIWGSPSSFSSFSSFADIKNGLMKYKVTDTNSDTNSIAFFIPVSTPLVSAAGNTYYITRWSGVNWNNTTDPTQAWIANLVDGRIYNCNATTCSKIDDTSILSHIGPVSTIVFYKEFLGNTTSKLSSLSCQSKLVDGSCWMLSNGSPVSDKSNDGILKNALALIDSTSLMNSGNHDNINVLLYNSGASAGNRYTIDSYGSQVFIHTGSDKIVRQSGYEGLIDATGATPSNTFNNHFGSEMN